MGNDTIHPIITSLFPGSGGRARTVFRVADPQPGRHHCTVNHGGGCMLLLLASDGCTMSSESFSSVTLVRYPSRDQGREFSLLEPGLFCTERVGACSSGNCTLRSRNGGLTNVRFRYSCDIALGYGSTYNFLALQSLLASHRQVQSSNKPNLIVLAY